MPNTIEFTSTFATTFNLNFYPTITPQRFTALCLAIDPNFMVDFDDDLDALFILFSDGSISVVRGEASNPSIRILQ